MKMNKKITAVILCFVLMLINSTFLFSNIFAETTTRVEVSDVDSSEQPSSSSEAVSQSQPEQQPPTKPQDQPVSSTEESSSAESKTILATSEQPTSQEGQSDTDISSRKKSSNTSSRKEIKNNEYWSEELEVSLSLSCDWLTNSKAGAIYFLCMGTAGKPAVAKSVNSYIVEVFSKETYETVLNLEYDILNLTFCGYNAANFREKNLVEKLGNYTAFADNDLYSKAYALLAIDSNEYALPTDSLNNRQGLISLLMTHANADGGFEEKEGGQSSVVQTALALTALSNYRTDPVVQEVIDSGLAFISENQQDNGTFLENGTESSIALSKTIVALSSLDIPFKDSRFHPRNAQTLPQILKKYVNVDGGFSSEPMGESDIVATENAILALTSVKKMHNPYVLINELQDSTFDSSSSVADGIQAGHTRTLILVNIGLVAVAAVVIAVYLSGKKTAGKVRECSKDIYVKESPQEPTNEGEQL